MSAGTGAAGAGLKTVMAPDARAISRPLRAASMGCSSWVTKTFAPSMALRAASTSLGDRPPAAPGTTMMAFSPVSSLTKI